MTKRDDRIFILNIAIHWIFPPADVIITSQTKTTKTVLLNQKRFYNRETFPLIRNLPYWLKSFNSIMISWEGKRVWKTFAVFIIQRGNWYFIMIILLLNLLNSKRVVSDISTGVGQRELAASVPTPFKPPLVNRWNE